MKKNTGIQDDGHPGPRKARREHAADPAASRRMQATNALSGWCEQH